jgi:hypothetical protein
VVAGQSTAKVLAVSVVDLVSVHIICLVSVYTVSGDHAWQLGDIGEFGKKTNFERATRCALYLVYNSSTRNVVHPMHALVWLMRLTVDTMVLACEEHL